MFEGADGTGKSTQLKLLADHLNGLGLDVVTTREPTDGQWGQKIRELYVNRQQHSPEYELELFVNDRKEHVQQQLTPALMAGKVVLCDRYFLSTVAYQSALGFDVDDIFDKNRFAPEPDMALIFQASVETSRQRIVLGRNEELNDFEQLDNLVKVATIFSRLDKPYIRTIDAEGSVDEVHQRVKNAIAPLLKRLPGTGDCQ
ncbi:thymidylate kinase [Desulforhopalus singaporensis]|uniref:Thymidylate kinase n=1 Tax=Desulforhopalus singaporensis TaxID=91360 RepID=A0A1H0MHP1_9BACT|nr:thymidylate kinase [Desulforhopalus singaporensis]